MSWSYSGNPSDSTLDEVRFLIGDTDTDDQLLSDEEINYTLTKGSVYNAAALSAEAIAATFSRLADKEVDDLKITYSQKSEQYKTLAASLRSQGASFGIVPYAGGISVSDKDSIESNTDRTTPSFKVGMDDAHQ